MFVFQSVAQKMPFEMKKEDIGNKVYNHEQMRQNVAPSVGNNIMEQMKTEHPNLEITRVLSEDMQRGDMDAFFREAMANPIARNMVESAYRKTAEGMDQKDIELVWGMFNQYLSEISQDKNMTEKMNTEFAAQKLQTDFMRKQSEEDAVDERKRA